jgi:hypothetical protein
MDKYVAPEGCDSIDTSVEDEALDWTPELLAEMAAEPHLSEVMNWD